MLPSTWNDTNQHWIPRFILKGFGIKGDASYIYEMCTESGEINLRKVEEVSSKLRLLSHRDDELLQSIEQNATRVIKQVRKGKPGVGREGRKAIDGLVRAMMQTNPLNGLDMDKTRMELIEAFKSEMSESIRRNGGIIDEQVLREYADSLITHDYLNIAMNYRGRENENLADKVLDNMGLRVHRIIPDEEESLVIGDSGVMAVRSESRTGRSLLNPGSQIILPINSRCVLVYSWESGQKVIEPGTDLTRYQVRSLNRDYFRNMNSSYIYGRRPEDLHQARIPNVLWTGGERSQAINEGWQRMQAEITKKQEAEENEKSEQHHLYDLFAKDLVRRAKLEMRESEQPPLC